MQSLQLRRNKPEANLDICISSHPAAQQDALLEEMARSEGLASQEIKSKAFVLNREFYGWQLDVRWGLQLFRPNVCAFADELQRVASRVDVVFDLAGDWTTRCLPSRFKY